MSAFKQALFLLAQVVVPHHLLSRFVGLFAQCRWDWFKNRLIHWFIKRYQVDMGQAAQPDAQAYVHFNDFFTRELKAGVRPLAQDPAAVLSPADGTVSQMGDIDEGRIFQAKGRYYSALELLGGDAELANQFSGGKFSTIYLSPKDYHRVHMPVTGTLRQTIYIPGRLFSVNPVTTENIPNLFARNERLVSIFDTECGPVAVVMVGAMIVAGIETFWSGQVTPPKRMRHQQFHGQAINLARGAEMGRFKLGSTVILLFGKDRLQWDSALAAQSEVRMGQLLGRLGSKAASSE